MKTLSIALVLVALAGGIVSGCENPAAPFENASALAEEGYMPEGQAGKTSADALRRQEVARLRAAIAKYHDIDKALADGYTVEFTGYRTQMGFHYLNPPLLDDQFEVERPEVLMYAPAANGGLRFVGVEYAVPIVDLQNPPPPPEGFSGGADAWAVNQEFSVWTLHVWVGLENPEGLFAHHNPRLP